MHNRSEAFLSVKSSACPLELPAVRCIFEMIQTSLETGQYAPCCPLCRTEIERMSDIVKEKVLAERYVKLRLSTMPLLALPDSVNADATFP